MQSQGHDTSDSGSEQGDSSSGQSEAVNQIAFADRILLNKTDLVSQEELDAVASTIRSINTLAPIERTFQSKVNMVRKRKKRGLSPPRRICPGF